MLRLVVKVQVGVERVGVVVVQARMDFGADPIAEVTNRAWLKGSHVFVETEGGLTSGKERKGTSVDAWKEASLRGRWELPQTCRGVGSHWVDLRGTRRLQTA